MSTSEAVVIYHNPACGTSRNVLALITAAGYTPTVIDYLQTGWTRPQLLGLFAAANLTPRTALRETKSPAAELGLLEPGAGDDTILDAMIAHPVLVNRPIVCLRAPPSTAAHGRSRKFLNDRFLTQFRRQTNRIRLPSVTESQDGPSARGLRRSARCAPRSSAPSRR